jgi:hypothetical protein
MVSTLSISSLSPRPSSSLLTEELSALPWQHLVELGIPAQDAKGIIKAINPDQAVQTANLLQRSLRSRELMPIYWRKLIEVGIPISPARIVAEGIARFDTLGQPLTSPQKKLICQYSALVCRAELWRSGMLLS